MAGRGRSVARPISTPPVAVDGVLVRMSVADGHWAEDIPPVPAGFEVTVSFGSAAQAAEHGDALELLGYRVVPGPPPAHPELADTADFLVTAALMERHPTYGRSLGRQAMQAYHLALGPAAAVVAAVVAAHTAPRRRRPRAALPRAARPTV